MKTETVLGKTLHSKIDLKARSLFLYIRGVKYYFEVFLKNAEKKMRFYGGW